MQVFFWKASRWKDHAYLRTFFHFYASKPAKDARLCEKFYFTRFFQIMRIFKKQPFYAKNYAGIIRPSINATTAACSSCLIYGSTDIIEILLKLFALILTTLSASKTL